MIVFDHKYIQIIFFSNFVTINLGLDPDPDWIRSQQQVGSGSGFSEISRSGFSENGPETLAEKGAQFYFKGYVSVLHEGINYVSKSVSY
jgi:hypothetical protein